MKKEDIASSIEAWKNDLSSAELNVGAACTAGGPADCMAETLASRELNTGIACTAGGPADCVAETLASRELNTGAACTAGGPADCIAENLASKDLDGVCSAWSLSACSTSIEHKSCR